MSPSPFHTAFILNNTAVSFMERNCLKLAAETLEDALQLMVDTTIPGQDEEDGCKQEQALLAAGKRNIQALGCTKYQQRPDVFRNTAPQQAFEGCDAEDHEAVITCISTSSVSDHDFDALRRVALSVELSPVCIALEDASIEYDSSPMRKIADNRENDHVYGIGVLLYNYGLVNYFLETSQPSNTNTFVTSTRLQTTAKWLKTAEIALSTLKEQVRNSHGDDEETECLARWMQILVLQLQGSVYSLLGNLGQAFEAHQIAESLLCHQEEQPVPLWLQWRKKAQDNASAA